MWESSGHGVLVGRNMDWLEDMHTDLWVMPRGVRRVGADHDRNPLRWTAKYGSLVASSYDETSSDGVNEKGLAAHMLWLAETDYGPRDPSVPGVSLALWTQLVLDKYATVAEVVEATTTREYQLIAQNEPKSGRPVTVHMAVDDSSGDSAIIEFIEGTPRVHHSRGYAVLTNSPPFDKQLELLARYEGFGGTKPLPGTTEAADRFVRASYYVSRLPRPDTRMHAYAALLSVMRNAAQPFGMPDPERPNISMTIWRTLIDLTNHVFAFESTFRPDVVWVHYDQLDFTRHQQLGLAEIPFVGDVTGNFKSTRPFEFLAA